MRIEIYSDVVRLSPYYQRIFIGAATAFVAISKLLLAASIAIFLSTFFTNTDRLINIPFSNPFDVIPREHKQEFIVFVFLCATIVVLSKGASFFQKYVTVNKTIAKTIFCYLISVMLTVLTQRLLEDIITLPYIRMSMWFVLLWIYVKASELIFDLIISKEMTSTQYKEAYTESFDDKNHQYSNNGGAQYDSVYKRKEFATNDILQKKFRSTVPDKRARERYLNREREKHPTRSDHEHILNILDSIYRDNR